MHALNPAWPVWYDPAAPLGSAVRYIAGLTSQVSWVGVFRRKGKGWVLGPCLGTRLDVKPGQAVQLVVSLSVPIRDQLVGQIRIQSHAPVTLDMQTEKAIRQVAKELGELWPE